MKCLGRAWTSRLKRGGLLLAVRVLGVSHCYLQVWIICCRISNLGAICKHNEDDFQFTLGFPPPSLVAYMSWAADSATVLAWSNKSTLRWTSAMRDAAPTARSANGAKKLDTCATCNISKDRKRNALYLSVNVFTKGWFPVSRDFCVRTCVKFTFANK